MKTSAPTPRPRIAVVGVSALFPGSLNSTGFWKDILAGRDLLDDVPPSHWLIDDYYDPDPSIPDKTYAKRGAFLKEIDFDAMAWGVPPSIVPETDTSQLLALIVAQRVLEDATRGAVEQLDRSRISVILGVTSGQELLGDMVSRLQRPRVAQGSTRKRDSRRRGDRGLRSYRQPLHALEREQLPWPAWQRRSRSHRQSTGPRRHQLRYRRSLRIDVFGTFNGRAGTTTRRF